MEKYIIQIEAPPGYSGANVLEGKRIGEVVGPNLPNWQGFYLLIQLLKPLEISGKKINQIIVSSRYEGVSLKDFDEKQITVSVAIVVNEIKANSQFNSADIEYWSVGEMARVKG